MTSVRLAAAQLAPVFLDRDRTVDKAVSAIAEAGRNGARLIAFPETWIPGYPLWMYGAAGWDDRRAKRLYARLQANSVTVGDEATVRLCEAARRAGTIVVMGINERDGDYSRGTLYNSLLYISAEGEVMGVRRKLMPTHAERLLWGQGDGSALQVYDTPIGRVGGAICWEHWMPLNRFAMHAKGEQIHVAAWPTMPPIHHLASQHYAFEGRCFVLCVGSYFRRSDVPADFEMPEAFDVAAQYGDGGDELISGGTGIIGPDSRWIAGPVVGREEIVYADADLSLIGDEQQAFDAVGHYNRPDVFRLTVDERPVRHVDWLRPPAVAAAEEPVAAPEDGALDAH